MKGDEDELCRERGVTAQVVDCHLKKTDLYAIGHLVWRHGGLARGHGVVYIVSTYSHFDVM